MTILKFVSLLGILAKDEQSTSPFLSKPNLEFNSAISFMGPTILLAPLSTNAEHPFGQSFTSEVPTVTLLF